MDEPAGEVLWGFTPAEAEYFRQMSEHKYEMDLQSEKVYARQEGLAEGRVEGRAEGVINTARNALAKGLSPEQVCDITGLDPETIARLKAGG